MTKSIDRPPVADLAILGAGPVGLEAAARAGELGWTTLVLEQGDVGANVRRWGSVRLFSPFELNAGPAGLRALGRAGRPLPDPDAILTGREFLERYLDPLASDLHDTIEVRTGARVIGVARDGWLKAEALGLPARAEKPFRILYDRAGREEETCARAILDCTGTFDRPAWAGPGGAPARGERRFRDRIAYHLPDLERDRPLFATGRTLLVGTGHSAATAAVWLSELAASGEARFLWSTRGPGAEGPLVPIENDPLPERAGLTRRANAVARRPAAGSEWVPGSRLREIGRAADGFEVLLDGREPRRERFDRVLALVGYEPDDGLYRQLQVHECYASRAPMKLAAALLAATGDGPVDCLAGGGFEAATLENPEPDFFILGAKSYGKGSAFLMQTGYEQVEDAFSLLAPEVLDPAV